MVFFVFFMLLIFDLEVLFIYYVYNSENKIYKKITWRL